VHACVYICVRDIYIYKERERERERERDKERERERDRERERERERGVRCCKLQRTYKELQTAKACTRTFVKLSAMSCT